jgi:C4-dicarboxylate-specific signal transduction histidine kinase
LAAIDGLLHRERKGIHHLVRKSADSRQLSVAADPVHLQQVIMNLLLNSLEAMRSTAAAARFT